MKTTDRHLRAAENAPAISWSSFAFAVGSAILTMVVAALLIWTCPTEGYRAGYDAAIAEGPAWIDAEIDAADGTAFRACDTLHHRTAGARGVEYGEFIAGCSAGVDHLSGRHIPVIAVG